MKYFLNCCCWSGSFLTYMVLVSLPVQAQLRIVNDGTLSTQVTSPDNANFTINLGDRSGNNLFHSFREFSIPTGGSATFNHALDIQNIFSRVTGGSVSTINGLIKAQGSANLFLLNPAGIIFGPNAQLNIGGSFVGSTASSLQFADGQAFMAASNGTSPLLTISVPIGLQFGSSSGGIQVQGPGHQLSGRTRPDVRSALAGAGSSTTGLRVNAGKTIALVGSDVGVVGGILSAPQGNIELGSVGSGLVSLVPQGQGWRLGYEQVQGFRDLQLSQKSLLDASGSGGGAIQLRGSRISLTEGSLALIQNQGTQPAGGIVLQASESVRLSGTTPDGTIQTGLHSQQLSRGDGGEIRVVAPQVEVLNGAAIAGKTFGKANNGNIVIDAANTLQVLGYSPIDSSNFSAIFSYTYDKGNTGNVTVSTGNLKSLDGGSIGAATLGSGQSGDLTVNAAESIELGGEEPNFRQFSTLFDISIGTGNAGNLTVNTQRLLVRDGGRVGASTVYIGNAGSIVVNASDSITVTGKAPKAGIPSQISSAGNVLPPQLQKLYGVPSLPTGNGGSVTVNTDRLTVMNGALVTVRNLGSGDAGILTVNANQIYLDQKGSIAASTKIGNGGNLDLQVRDAIVLRNGSSITATAGGTGNGGNLILNSPIIVGLENSDIVARASKGNGGTIQITTQSLLGLKFRDRLTPENDITASSEFGINGNVQVNTIGINPTNGLMTLPVDIMDSSRQISDRCHAAQTSSFTATGRGGIPNDPKQKLSQERTWHDFRPIATTVPSIQAIQAKRPVVELTTPIVEANAFQIDEFGAIDLIATHVPVERHHPASCS